MLSRWSACACVLLTISLAAAAPTDGNTNKRPKCPSAHKHHAKSACKKKKVAHLPHRKVVTASKRLSPVSALIASTTPIPAPAGTAVLPSEPANPRKLIWDDEFKGPTGASPDTSKWNFDSGGSGWGNDELESYTDRPANASLNGEGQLAVTARAERFTGEDGISRDYTSARLQTLGKFEFEYGLMEARIKVPSGQGLVGQFWSLGNDAYKDEGWPDCGEIDAMEILGSETSVLNGTIHGPWSEDPNGVGGTSQSSSTLSASYHTYGVEWGPEQINFLLDGHVYKTITPADVAPGLAWPFRHPYFLLLDLAVGGEWPGSPNSSTHFPAQMLVDWVRVWQ